MLERCGLGWSAVPVGQMAFHGTPDPLHRVLVRAVAGTVEKLDFGVLGRQAHTTRLEWMITLSSTTAIAFG
jgi:hypothetical protein